MSRRFFVGATKFNFHMNFARTARSLVWSLLSMAHDFQFARRESPHADAVFSVEKCINLHSSSMCLFRVVRVGFHIFFYLARRSSIYRWLYYFSRLPLPPPVRRCLALSRYPRLSVCDVVICSVAIKRSRKKTVVRTLRGLMEVLDRENMFVLLAWWRPDVEHEI